MTQRPRCPECGELGYLHQAPIGDTHPWCDQDKLALPLDPE